MSKPFERERFAMYWGKTNSSGLFHPLASHSLDAVAVASEWLAQDGSLRRALARACGCEEGKAKAWTLFFIGLHDLGKWDARFQLKDMAM